MRPYGTFESDQELSKRYVLHLLARVLPEKEFSWRKRELSAWPGDFRNVEPPFGLCHRLDVLNKINLLVKQWIRGISMEKVIPSQIFTTCQLSNFVAPAVNTPLTLWVHVWRTFFVRVFFTPTSKLMGCTGAAVSLSWTVSCPIAVDLRPVIKFLICTTEHARVYGRLGRGKGVHLWFVPFGCPHQRYVSKKDKFDIFGQFSCFTFCTEFIHWQVLYIMFWFSLQVPT